MSGNFIYGLAGNKCTTVLVNVRVCGKLRRISSSQENDMLSYTGLRQRTTAASHQNEQDSSAAAIPTTPAIGSVDCQVPAVSTTQQVEIHPLSLAVSRPANPPKPLKLTSTTPEFPGQMSSAWLPWMKSEVGTRMAHEAYKHMAANPFTYILHVGVPPTWQINAQRFGSFLQPKLPEEKALLILRQLTSMKALDEVQTSSSFIFSTKVFRTTGLNRLDSALQTCTYENRPLEPEMRKRIKALLCTMEFNGEALVYSFVYGNLRKELKIRDQTDELPTAIRQYGTTYCLN